MKKLICIMVMIIITQSAYSQWIMGLSVNPPNPTTIDNIQVIVDATFPSGGCSEWYIAGQMQNGFEYTYYIVNCLGMLTVICPYHDTINMGGNLPAGNYSVIINLNAGYDVKPCGPFYQWSSDTLYFTVSPFTGISMINRSKDFLIYPNPANDYLTVEVPELSGETLCSIYNLQGQLLSRQIIWIPKEEIDISTLASGVFIIKLCDNEGILVKKFIKK